MELFGKGSRRHRDALEKEKAAEAAFNSIASNDRSGSGAGALAVFLAETFDATRCVDDFLLAGIERVASRTHFDVQGLAVGRAGLELVAAAASHLDLVVLRVDAFFHDRVLKSIKSKLVLAGSA
jgi:hypothetical protein